MRVCATAILAVPTVPHGQNGRGTPRERLHLYATREFAGPPTGTVRAIYSVTAYRGDLAGQPGEQVIAQFGVSDTTAGPANATLGNAA